MKYLYSIAVILLLSCQQNNNPVNNNQDKLQNEITPSLTKIDSTSSKEWVIKVIREYFNGKNNDMSTITTPEYNSFKMDAMNVDLGIDGSLTSEQFTKKWSDKFPLETHPTQIGFLISAQDWGKISVPRIIVKTINDNSITFETIINDDEYETSYQRDIHVIQNDGKYFIADVLEYD